MFISKIHWKNRKTLTVNIFNKYNELFAFIHVTYIYQPTKITHQHGFKTLVAKAKYHILLFASKIL